MSGEPDALLWARVLTDDGEAFGVLFDRHRVSVRRQAARFLDGVDDIEDAVAVVFLEAWRRRRSVRLVDGSVRPWLLVTAANVSRTLRRSARRYAARLAELPAPEPADRPADQLGGSDVLEALRRLSAVDQQVLTLCVLEEYPEREAAELLRVRPGTVKSRLHRAKARLAVEVSGLAIHDRGRPRHGI